MATTVARLLWLSVIFHSCLSQNEWFSRGSGSRQFFSSGPSNSVRVVTRNRATQFNTRRSFPGNNNGRQTPPIPSTRNDRQRQGNQLTRQSISRQRVFERQRRQPEQRRLTEQRGQQAEQQRIAQQRRQETLRRQEQRRQELQRRLASQRRQDAQRRQDSQRRQDAQRRQDSQSNHLSQIPLDAQRRQNKSRRHVQEQRQIDQRRQQGLRRPRPSDVSRSTQRRNPGLRALGIDIRNGVVNTRNIRIGNIDAAEFDRLALAPVSRENAINHTQSNEARTTQRRFKPWSPAELTRRQSLEQQRRIRQQQQQQQPILRRHTPRRPQSGTRMREVEGQLVQITSRPRRQALQETESTVDQSFRSEFEPNVLQWLNNDRTDQATTSTSRGEPRFENRAVFQRSPRTFSRDRTRSRGVTASPAERPLWWETPSEMALTTTTPASPTTAAIASFGDWEPRQILRQRDRVRSRDRSPQRRRAFLQTPTTEAPLSDEFTQWLATSSSSRRASETNTVDNEVTRDSNQPQESSFRNNDIFPTERRQGRRRQTAARETRLQDRVDTSGWPQGASRRRVQEEHRPILTTPTPLTTTPYDPWAEISFLRNDRQSQISREQPQTSLEPTQRRPESIFDEPRENSLRRAPSGTLFESPRSSFVRETPTRVRPIRNERPIDRMSNRDVFRSTRENTRSAERRPILNVEPLDMPTTEAPAIDITNNLSTSSNPWAFLDDIGLGQQRRPLRTNTDRRPVGNRERQRAQERPVTRDRIPPPQPREDPRSSTIFTRERVTQAENMAFARSNAQRIDAPTPIERLLEASVLRGRPISRDLPAPSDRQSSRDRPPSRDRPAPRDQPAPRDRPPSRDRPAPRDQPAPRDRPAPSDRQLSRDRPASRDRPVSRLSTEAQTKADGVERTNTDGWSSILDLISNEPATPTRIPLSNENEVSQPTAVAGSGLDNLIPSSDTNIPVNHSQTANTPLADVLTPQASGSTGDNNFGMDLSSLTISDTAPFSPNFDATSTPSDSSTDNSNSPSNAADSQRNNIESTQSSAPSLNPTINTLADIQGDSDPLLSFLSSRVDDIPRDQPTQNSQSTIRTVLTTPTRPPTTTTTNPPAQIIAESIAAPVSKHRLDTTTHNALQLALGNLQNNNPNQRVIILQVDQNGKIINRPQGLANIAGANLQRTTTPPPPISTSTSTTTRPPTTTTRPPSTTTRPSTTTTHPSTTTTRPLTTTIPTTTSSSAVLQLQEQLARQEQLLQRVLNSLVAGRSNANFNTRETIPSQLPVTHNAQTIDFVNRRVANKINRIQDPGQRNNKIQQANSIFSNKGLGPVRLDLTAAGNDQFNHQHSSLESNDAFFANPFANTQNSFSTFGSQQERHLQPLPNHRFRNNNPNRPSLRRASHTVDTSNIPRPNNLPSTPVFQTNPMYTTETVPSPPETPYIQGGVTVGLEPEILALRQAFDAAMFDRLAMAPYRPAYEHANNKAELSNNLNTAVPTAVNPFATQKHNRDSVSHSSVDTGRLARKAGISWLSPSVRSGPGGRAQAVPQNGTDSAHINPQMSHFEMPNVIGKRLQDMHPSAPIIRTATRTNIDGTKDPKNSVESDKVKTAVKHIMARLGKEEGMKLMKAIAMRSRQSWQSRMPNDKFQHVTRTPERAESQLFGRQEQAQTSKISVSKIRERLRPRPIKRITFPQQQDLSNEMLTPPSASPLSVSEANKVMSREVKGWDIHIPTVENLASTPVKDKLPFWSETKYHNPALTTTTTEYWLPTETLDIVPPSKADIDRQMSRSKYHGDSSQMKTNNRSTRNRGPIPPLLEKHKVVDRVQEVSSTIRRTGSRSNQVTRTAPPLRPSDRRSRHMISKLVTPDRRTQTNEVLPQNIDQLEALKQELSRLRSMINSIEKLP